MEVERLDAVLEVSGLSTFMAQMGAADRATAGPKDQLAALARISEIASAALKTVRMSQAQAAETSAVAQAINRSVSSVTATAVAAADQLEQVKLGASQAASTASAAAAMKASIAGVASQAADARRSLEGMAAVGAVSSRIGGVSTGGAVAGSMGGWGGGGGSDMLVMLGRPGSSNTIATTLRDLGWTAAVAGGASGGGGKGGIMSALGWGNGMFGMAGFGSALGLAGFGAERAITSTIGVAGSLGGGLLGGGLLGLGALGTGAVGIGTDLAGIGQAAGDIKTVSTALGNLQTAIQTYGKNSQQAAQAQQQLNQALGGFSPVARGAVLAAAQTSQQFKAMFDQATGLAEKTGAEILNQAMKTGEAFLPTLGKFAAQNMGIIQQGLQPLFAWLKNPAFTAPGVGGGLGIFTNLEQIFQSNLPTSVHALSQGFELLMKTVDVAAQHLGGFVQMLDRVFTKFNGSGFSTWANEVNKLIGLFETWLHLFGAVGGALFDLLKPAVGFGQQLAAGLTVVIDKVRQWLSGAGMQDTLHAVFQAHLNQLKAVFGIIVSALPALEQFAQAFLRIEAAVSTAFAILFKMLSDVIRPLMQIPFAPQVLGWAGALLVVEKAVRGVITSGAILRAMLLGLGPAALKGAGTADAAVASVGDAAATSTAEVDALRFSLLSLPGAAAVGLAAIGVYEGVKWMQGKAKDIATQSGGNFTLNGNVGGGNYALGAGRVAGRVTGPGPGGGGYVTPVPLPHGVGVLTGAHNSTANDQRILLQAQLAAEEAKFAKMFNIPGPGVLGVPPLSSFGGGGGAGGGAGTFTVAGAGAGQLASHYAALASALNNTGAAARNYLMAERAALLAQQAALHQQLKTASAQNKAQIQAALSGVSNSLVQVGQQIKDAIIVSGSALLNSGLRTKLAGLSAQFKADSAYAAALTGQAATDYNKILKADLTAQAGALEQAVMELKGKLAGADSAHRKAIQQELAAVESNLSQVQQSIISNLQSTVQALQQNVQTIFSQVQTEMDTALGNLYYQNGLKTPSEALLASMQAADQLKSLQDAITQAQQQLQTDTQGAILKHVLNVATGQQWNVMNPAAAAQIAADQQALAAAQRQLVEYNLSIKAAQERSQADAAYAQQVQSLNAKLAQWEQSILNGTGSMQGLRDIAAQFGIQIDTSTIPDFAKLSTAAGDLKQALEDLVAYIEKITGKTPAPIPGGGSSGGGGGTGGGTVTLPGGITVPAGVIGGGFGGGFGSTYTPSGSSDALSRYLANALPGHAVAMASGGIVKARPGGTLIRAGEAGMDEAIIPLGGRRIGGDGVTVNLHVSALDPSSVNWDEIAKKATPAFRRELYRTKSRNGPLDF